MKPLYEARAKKLIRKKFAELANDYVQPLTNLPIELNIEMQIVEKTFLASASVGHPHFGYFGLVLRGLVLDILGIPVSLFVDEMRTFMYPLTAEENRLVLDPEAPVISSTDIRKTALTANKVLFINDILSSVLEQNQFEALAKQINAYISNMLVGRL